MSATRTTNFAVLQEHDEQLLRLGMLAEKYFPEDPNSALLKLRQFGELLAQITASRVGMYASPEESQLDLLRRLQGVGIIPDDVAQLFHEVRRAGNAASHALRNDHRSALTALKLCWQLALWFHRTFTNPSFASGPFIPPKPPVDESAELRAELDELRAALSTYKSATDQTAERLQATEAKLKEARDEQSFWEQLALEAESAKLELERRLAEEQAASEKASQTLVGKVAKAATNAARSVVLDEADTRKLVDAKLRDAGWEADTVELTYAKGARPEKGVNRAIAEWPTESGPVDYALFVGLTPIAVVEAKRQSIDVAAAVQQAKRYSRGFLLKGELAPPGGPWGEFRIPFVFATNGRPFLQQLKTKSGIWFCDVRRTQNHARPLESWHAPGDLFAHLKRDEEAAHRQLAQESFAYGFPIREYQREAIIAVEKGVTEGRRAMLVAMATGTGKTKTCIALIYRLLKVQRFRRVLFLVDRSALGEQAANAFKDTRMESLQTFADVFGIKELDEPEPATETAVHIATVQGMVRRVLFPADDEAPPPVGQYDCIVVDECHRGYLLDRELSDTELSFRGFDDFISKYRRVLDYFDAVKIGLTATPALHTTEIFGHPIYTYTYRQAVIEGYLIDHEPPLRITTELSESGITMHVGEPVQVYDPRDGGLSTVTMPDTVTFDVADFNRKVITEPFNRVVCEWLAEVIDPTSPQKTLVFCVSDAHADMVVALLKESFSPHFPMLDDDAVMKITGSVDRPLEAIRLYRNERNPNVAVTVDLLTTGIDVPAITNLVFLRRVNSRILYEQMLGRATRLCDEVGKEVFRIYDAVDLYARMQATSEMKPGVINPKTSFATLEEHLTSLEEDEHREYVRGQFVAKLRRKKRYMSEASARDFESIAGMPPDVFVEELVTMPLGEIAAWFIAHPGLGEILDRTGESGSTGVFVDDTPDARRSVSHGYGDGRQKPEDFLHAFSAYIRSNSNTIPALFAVLTRPRELTRKQLRELATELDKKGFSEASIRTAWRDKTNQEVAATIVGYVRQAAMGDPLVPYPQRVERALQRILASRQWTPPQQTWLKKIAAQTKANIVVDREAMEDRDQIFSTQGGGFDKLNTIFDGELENVLAMFNEQVWTPAA